MKNDEEPFADKKTGEEEIIDFEFDELANDTGDTELAGVEEEEIIELVDVVEGGEEPSPPVSETAEIERLLDEEGPLEEGEIEDLSGENIQQEPAAEEVIDSGVSEPAEEDEFELLESEETRAIPGEETQPSLEKETQDLTLDLDSALETIEPLEEEVSSQEWSEPEPSEPEEEGEAELEELTPIAEEEEAPPEAEAMESTVKLPAEDLSAIPVPGAEPLGMEGGAEVPFAAATGISEERLEEIVTQAVKEAVQDSLETVVERAARETMTGVAERLITNAIEALKESLASESE
ncbi:MAG: hypothetical protein JRI80_10335 [Deltaproteobacteria bacterium]|nr:hypothetical protein [Deltaproteobacteria bacterium]